MRTISIGIALAGASASLPPVKDPAAPAAMATKSMAPVAEAQDDAPLPLLDQTLSLARPSDRDGGTSIQVGCRPQRFIVKRVRDGHVEIMQIDIVGERGRAANVTDVFLLSGEGPDQPDLGQMPTPPAMLSPPRSSLSSSGSSVLTTSSSPSPH